MEFETLPAPATPQQIPVHERTARRIAAWLGHADTVPAAVACKLQKGRPYARQKWFADAERVLQYMALFPNHRFPEREGAAFPGMDRTPPIQAAIVMLGNPPSFYRDELMSMVDGATAQWLRSVGRGPSVSILWELGYERWPNPNDRTGRWTFNNRPQPRYRLRAK